MVILIVNINLLGEMIKKYIVCFGSLFYFILFILDFLKSDVAYGPLF